MSVTDARACHVSADRASPMRRASALLLGRTAAACATAAAASAAASSSLVAEAKAAKAEKPPPPPKSAAELVMSVTVRGRHVFLNGRIDDESAKGAIATLMWLENDAPGTPIRLHINSGGGKVSAGLAIHDAMQARYPPLLSSPLLCSPLSSFLSSHTPLSHRIAHRRSPRPCTRSATASAPPSPRCCSRVAHRAIAPQHPTLGS